MLGSENCACTLKDVARTEFSKCSNLSKRISILAGCMLKYVRSTLEQGALTRSIDYFLILSKNSFRYFHSSYCEGEFSSREVGILQLHFFFSCIRTFWYQFSSSQGDNQFAEKCALSGPLHAILSKVHTFSLFHLAREEQLNKLSSIHANYFTILI